MKKAHVATRHWLTIGDQRCTIGPITVITSNILNFVHTLKIACRYYHCNIFNIRTQILFQSRSLIEQANGQLKNNFPCLHGDGMQITPARACDIIFTCCVLFNMNKMYLIGLMMTSVGHQSEQTLSTTSWTNLRIVQIHLIINCASFLCLRRPKEYANFSFVPRFFLDHYYYFTWVLSMQCVVKTELSLLQYYDLKGFEW